MIRRGLARIALVRRQRDTRVFEVEFEAVDLKRLGCHVVSSLGGAEYKQG
jgi:hypothetical protein